MLEHCCNSSHSYDLRLLNVLAALAPCVLNAAMQAIHIALRPDDT